MTHVERGFLTPRELWTGVKYQVEEIVRSLFSYPAGELLFWEGEIQPDNVVRLSLDTSRLISEGLDRNLGLGERIGLRMHLWMCDSCRLFKQQMDYLRHALRRGWTRGDLPRDKPLPEEAKERIWQAIREQTGAGGS